MSSTYSRRFRLMKSCFPDPIIPPPPSAVAAAATTISAIPDDVLLDILSRVSTSSLRPVSSVCRLWSHFVHSHSFVDLRRQHGLLNPSVFVFSPSADHTSIVTARLDHGGGGGIWRNVSFALPDDVVATGCFRVVAISTTIYVVCKTVTLKCDVWTGRVMPKSGMIYPRKKFAAAVLNGKIYVAGGSGSTSAVEEYDPEADTWAVVSHAPRLRYGCVGAATGGVFYVIGGLKVGNSGTRAAGTSFASSIDLYNVATGRWLRGREVPGGGCLVAACAFDGDLYVLASHAVELSFWRFNGRRGEGFGGWCRLKSPPVRGMVGFSGAVRFGCVAAGEKVVLIQVMGSVDNLLRRGSRDRRGFKQGLVLIYDTVVKGWTRGPNLPEVIKRATAVCVEC